MAEAERVSDGPAGLGSMVGTGPPMRRLFDLLARLAISDATVLVRGETGVGKELVARTLHEQSRRAGGPFVVFDCAAVPESLLAGELFGHVRGAFTGAHRDHMGAFERAHGGTLFIDEIGEMATELQPKLLRALETRTVRRIGDQGEQQLDVRIIAATHRDLAAMVQERHFREDLLYRLAVVTVMVPPLRERLEDLEALIARFAGSIVPPPPPTPPDVLAEMRRHRWPGNLRELRNLVERAAALASWRDELAAPLATRESQHTPPAVPSAFRFREAKERAVTAFERDFLADLLAANQNNLSRAARNAGMDRSHLSFLVRKYGLK